MPAASERRVVVGHGADVDEAYAEMVLHFEVCSHCEDVGAELAPAAALCRRGEGLRTRWEKLESGDLEGAACGEWWAARRSHFGLAGPRKDAVLVACRPCLRIRPTPQLCGSTAWRSFVGGRRSGRRACT